MGKQALILSSGGAKVAYHLGFLWVAEQAGYSPDMVVGVSAGAIAGAAWAYNKLDSAVDMVMDLDEDRIHKRRSFFWMGARLALAKIGLAPLPMSLYTPSGLAEIIMSILGQTATQPRCILRAGRVNLATGEYESTVSSNAPLMARQILASATIPGFWPPIRIDGAAYVDGGVRNMASLSEPIDEFGDELSQMVAVITEPLRMKGGKSGNIIQVTKTAVGIVLKEGLISDVEQFIMFNAMATDLARRKEASLDQLGKVIHSLEINTEKRNELLAAVAQAVVNTSYIKHPKKERPIHPYDLVLVEPTEDLGNGTDFSNGHFKDLLRAGESRGLSIFKDRVNQATYRGIF